MRRMMMHCFILLGWERCRRYSLIETTIYIRRRIWSTCWWCHFRGDITRNILDNNIGRKCFDGFIIFEIITIRTDIIVFLNKERSVNQIEIKSNRRTTISGYNSTALSSNDRALWVRSIKYLHQIKTNHFNCLGLNFPYPCDISLLVTGPCDG